MINWFMGAIGTLRFELIRSFTIQRVASSVVLVLFPPSIIGLVLGSSYWIQNRSSDQNMLEGITQMQASTPFAIIFLVSLVCLLALLLWAPTNVSSELEGKSWGFVASRPGGRMAVYLGKYFTAVLASFLISLTAMSLSVFLAHRLDFLVDARQLWISLAGIYLLASIAYGAVFSMLGTIFFKRAMVVAAGYLIGSEVFLASVPALIGKLTLRYHLQELGIRWIGFFLPTDTESEYRALFGLMMPQWVHFLAIGIGTLVTLVIGAIVITNRQYITSEEE